ncbi:MAG TPA: GHMP kinase [Acidobacteriota bacterium]|nr:GHMP kinase [Acidobacteriota bacterium]
MTNKDIRPLRVINSVAPIRICDNGGWTDTWFAGTGRIFNIAVYPYAEVQIAAYPLGSRKDRIVINAENFGDRYVLRRRRSSWDRHPLLEAAVEFMNVPRNLALEMTIFSEAPSGASTGTSAAVTVALIAALDCLSPGRLLAHEVASAAHRIETEMLKKQSGIQDQLCSAYGGINYIEMFSYPYAAVSPIPVPNAIWWELERRLALIYLGKSHDSSELHETVIRTLEHAGPSSPKLDALRETAPRSRDALMAGNFKALGKAMVDNTEAQRRLHAGLVSPDADKIIRIAKAHGALGWKVNGAGGEGGSLTLLCGSRSDEKRALIKAIEQASPLFRNIPIYLSRQGLRVWEQP